MSFPDHEHCTKIGHCWQDHVPCPALAWQSTWTTDEAKAASEETGVPISEFAYKRGEETPVDHDSLLAVEYTVYPDYSEEGDGIKPRKILMWVGLDPDVGAPNIDAGRERLEEEGWQVTEWAAA